MGRISVVASLDVSFEQRRFFHLLSTPTSHEISIDTMNPTVVICPVGWPLVSFFEPLMAAFETQGYPAICKLPEEYPDESESPSQINPGAVHLRDHVLDPLAADGKSIILFMHSYGGIYGPQALEGLSRSERAQEGKPGGVIAMVFVAAFVAPRGVSAVAAMEFDQNNLPDWMD
jgi:pimeloyl-ACP methyl ester carboxylesterase